MSEAADAGPGALSPVGARGWGSFRVWTERPGRASTSRRELPLFLVAAGVATLSFFIPFLKAHGAWVSVPCVFHWATGLPCLTCGLTRSFVFTAHGDLAPAFEMHLLGPLLFAGTVATAAYLGFAAVTGTRVRYELSGTARRIAFWSVLGIFFTSWLLKIVFMRGSW